MRRVLYSGPHVMYRIAEDHGFIHQYEDTLYGLTAIKHAARKIVILAAENRLALALRICAHRHP